MDIISHLLFIFIIACSGFSAKLFKLHFSTIKHLALLSVEFSLASIFPIAGQCRKYSVLVVGLELGRVSWEIDVVY